MAEPELEPRPAEAWGPCVKGAPGSHWRWRQRPREPGGKGCRGWGGGGRSPPRAHTSRDFRLLRATTPAPRQETGRLCQPPPRPPPSPGPWATGLEIPQGMNPCGGQARPAGSSLPTPRTPTHLIGPRFWNSSRITARALSSASALMSDFFFLQLLKENREGGVATAGGTSFSPPGRACHPWSGRPSGPRASPLPGSFLPSFSPLQPGGSLTMEMGSATDPCPILHTKFHSKSIEDLHVRAKAQNS